LKEGFVRKTIAIVAALGILTALTACSGNGSSQGCDNPIVSGDASSVVTATGALGSSPTVDFPTPIITQTTQKTELITGKGAPLQAGQPILFEATLLNGANAAMIDKTGYNGTKNLLTLGQSTLPALSHGLECSQVGARVAIASSVKEGAATGGTSADGGAGSVVFVADIIKAFPAMADGAAQVPQNGMPAVVLAPNGAPGITIPNETAPTTLKIDVLQAGSGAKVAEGDTVVVKYTGVTWHDSTVFDSSWKKGQAALFQLKSGTVIPGFQKGLVGQKVGSQMLLVVPPKDGYGSAGSGLVPANATLVFVVDILGIAR
jgi:hypothetical protein